MAVVVVTTTTTPPQAQARLKGCRGGGGGGGVAVLLLLLLLCCGAAPLCCRAQQWPLSLQGPSSAQQSPQTPQQQQQHATAAANNDRAAAYLHYGHLDEEGAVVPAATTRVLVNEDEYIFIAFEGPSRVEYDVHVLEGPNVDVFLMDEDNFRLYAVDAWASSAWRVIDQGSKQGTRRAWARLRVGPGLWFLVVDNRADDYDVLPSGPASGPALLHLSFNTSSATIFVPPDSDKKPQSGDDASSGDGGGSGVGGADKNARVDRSIVARSAPVLRWSLLLFFAALPGWPLWRHYSIMVEYAGGRGPAGGLWAWLPFFACAGAAAALPLATLEQSLHRMLQGVAFLRQFPPLLTLLDALFAVAFPEEAVKWVVAILTLPVVTYGKRGRGAYLLHGATVAIAFALVENLYYGFGFDVLSSSSPFDTLFIRGITSIPSHVVGGVIMGCLLYRATSWWGFIKALVVPMFLHTIYDYPILLAHQGLFDKDILYMYLMLLLYLEDSIAHHLVLDPQGEQQHQQQQE